jgi:hypothetical protein
MAWFWIVVDRFGLILALGGLIAPILGCVLGALFGSRRQLGSGEYLTGRWAGRGFALGALATVPLLYLGMCGTPPGQGVSAREGYRRAEVILRALEAYRTQLGAYPDSLKQLTPDFLPLSALAGPQDGLPFEFRRLERGFVLSFKYGRPGMNECLYPSSAKSWTCSGYF